MLIDFACTPARAPARPQPPAPARAGRARRSRC
jgi:hypothetical protein